MLNNPKVWDQAIPAPSFNMVGYQSRIDSIVGKSPSGAPIVKLAWTHDVYDLMFGKRVYRYGVKDGAVRPFIPPRFVLMQRHERGQYWDSWNASRFIEDPGTGEIHDRGEPPAEMYTHLKTIANHNDFCCKFAWQEDRANCFGEYREPGDDTLAALKQARDERDARPYTNPHEPLSEADIALAMAEGAKQAAEQKAKSAQLAREMWDDYYKLYGHKARGESQGVVRSFPTPGFTETKTGLLVPEGTYAG
jgi:hypothetical protein